MDLAESLAHRLPDDERHPWEQVRFEFIHSLIKKHSPLHAGDVILDVGCGDGYVVEQLALQYPDCHFLAIDPAFTDAQLLQLPGIIKAVNVHFFKEIPEAIPFGKSTAVSLVLLMDVIEHIESDTDFLRSLLRYPIITASTSFVITVPAFQFLFAKHDRALGHYRRYTIKNLQLLLRNNNFGISVIGYFFFLPFLIRIVESVGQQIFHFGKNNNKRLLHWKANSFSSTLTRAILRADVKITETLKKIRLNYLGLSLYCIAKIRRKQ